MRLSTALPYTGDPELAARTAHDLESAGIDMLWVAELYSLDAVSILGYLAARTERVELGTGILPIYSRTPALTAMTAAGLDAVSGGRFVLGLGTSGPQVVEGWHGVPFDRPMLRTREVVDICRMVWRREPLAYDGSAYPLPFTGPGATGLGKPLKLVHRPRRERIPIYLASLGPRNVRLTAEVAEGWLPIFFHPDKAAAVWGDDLAAGAARRSVDLDPLEVVAGGTVAICDEAEAQRLRDLARPSTALYVGGMGARGQNFYNDVFCRYGYEAEAARIQDLYLDGKRAEAEALVPDDFLRATTLAGDEGFVRDRIEAFRAAGVTRLSISPVGDDPLALVEKVKGWVT